MNFERIIEFSPAFDKRDPDPKKNFGIHGVEMRWVLKGGKGAVQFLVFTNWQLPHVREESMERLAHNNLAEPKTLLKVLFLPMAADFGYHSKFPMYEGQEPVPCPYLDGAPCYYDGSGLNAERVFALLVEKGGEAVWKELEECYRQQFDEERRSA